MNCDNLKIALISNLWLYFTMVFPVYCLYCKADEVANCAIPAKWCLLDYMNFVETFTIIARAMKFSICIL